MKYNTYYDTKYLFCISVCLESIREYVEQLHPFLFMHACFNYVIYFVIAIKLLTKATIVHQT